MTAGNANQADQGQRLNSGAFGGIEDLHYETLVAKKTTFTLDGHSIFDDHDYSVSLGLVRDDLGFVRVHFENFRTWDSGTGGYIPDAQLSYALPGDALALDRGKISFERGWPNRTSRKSPSNTPTATGTAMKARPSGDRSMIPAANIYRRVSGNLQH